MQNQTSLIFQLTEIDMYIKNLRAGKYAYSPQNHGISCKQAWNTHSSAFLRNKIQTISTNSNKACWNARSLGKAPETNKTAKQWSDRGLLYKLSSRTLIVEFECFQMLTSLHSVVYHLVIWIWISYARLQSSGSWRWPTWELHYIPSSKQPDKEVYVSEVLANKDCIISRWKHTGI